MRSLHTWVEVYNRWQALGGWIPGQAPTFLDAYQFQETVAVPMLKALTGQNTTQAHINIDNAVVGSNIRHNVCKTPRWQSPASIQALDWVKLFDPVAHAKLQQTRAAADYKKVKVSWLGGIKSRLCSVGHPPKGFWIICYGQFLWIASEFEVWTTASTNHLCTKVSMPSFFTAAVFLSNAISKRPLLLHEGHPFRTI